MSKSTRTMDIMKSAIDDASPLLTTDTAVLPRPWRSAVPDGAGIVIESPPAVCGANVSTVRPGAAIAIGSHFQAGVKTVLIPVDTMLPTGTVKLIPSVAPVEVS